MAGKNPIKFTDTTFRDGHQSLLATRMRSEDIIPFMERMDQMGYFAIEVWGGATFDTTHRFLGDDPWERIRTIKGILKKTPTMMLLRGQNLVGYRNYADDLTYRFVRYAAEAGVDIFRVFDALNDMRNWEVAVKALMDAKKAGLMAHFQAAVCYSLTQRRMGGPIFNLDYYVNFTKKSEDMGADSVVLKVMAGMCSPNDAYAIIKGMKETIKIPVEFHTHYTSGSGSMSYLKAIEAGVDVLDTCLSPFALRTSQPAIEPLIVAVEQTDRATDMDLAGLIEIGYDLEKVAVKYRDLLDTSKMAQIDTGVLLHQIPGGMYSNLVNQLKELDALDRIHEVMDDLPQTRQELGQVIHHLVDPVQGVQLFELVHQVGVHAPGDLVQQHPGVDLGHLGGVQQVPVLHRHLLQVVADLDQARQVHVGFPVSLLHRHDERLNGRLRGPQRKGRQAGVQHVHARLDGLQVAHGARARGVVGVELHRDLDGLLHPLDDGVGVIGGAHPGHVLQNHRVGPHVLALLGKVDVVVQVEDGPAHAPLGQRVAHRRLEVGHEAGLFGVHQGLDRNFPVAHVV